MRLDLAVDSSEWLAGLVVAIVTGGIWEDIVDIVFGATGLVIDVRRLRVYTINGARGNRRL